MRAGGPKRSSAQTKSQHNPRTACGGRHSSRDAASATKAIPDTRAVCVDHRMHQREGTFAGDQTAARLALPVHCALHPRPWLAPQPSGHAAGPRIDLNEPCRLLPGDPGAAGLPALPAAYQSRGNADTRRPCAGSADHGDQLRSPAARLEHLYAAERQGAQAAQPSASRASARLSRPWASATQTTRKASPSFYTGQKKPGEIA